MALIGETQTDLAEAFGDELSDIVEDFTLIKRIKGAYDADAGKHSYISEFYNGRGVFEAYQTKELTDEIKIGDLKIICLVNELDETPDIDDLIDRNDKELTIVNVTPVFGITYEIQIREN